MQYRPTGGRRNVIRSRSEGPAVSWTKMCDILHAPAYGRNVRERGLATPGRPGQQQDLVERARVIHLVTAAATTDTAAATTAAAAAATVAKARVRGAAAGWLSVSAVSKVSVGLCLCLCLCLHKGRVAGGGGGALASALGKHDRIPRLAEQQKRRNTPRRSTDNTASVQILNERDERKRARQHTKCAPNVDFLKSRREQPIER